MSGKTYIEFIEDISQLTTIEEPPLIQIGDLYRLLSPLDIWATLARFVKAKDMELLSVCFLNSFAGGNPLIQPANEEERWIIEFNKEKTYSHWIREGLVQSLILVGIYGNGLKLADITDAQAWVDTLVNKLLSDATGDLWVSLDREMPLLAEAAPEVFLNTLDAALGNTDSAIMKLFEEQNGFLTKMSHHTGLLWALESLAWLPEYLEESALILARLARLDPGGQLSNRPFGSLSGIFKIWHYQTLASLEERMNAVRKVCQAEPLIGWRLLISLLPEAHGIAIPTHKMRWRVFNRNFNMHYTYQEMWEMTSFAVDELIVFMMVLIRSSNNCWISRLN